MRIKFLKLIIIFSLAILYSCNTKNDFDSINTSQIELKSDSIYNILLNYKTVYNNLKYQEEISKVVGELKIEVTKAKKSHNYNKLKGLLTSPFLKNEVSILEINNIEATDPINEVINYKLKIIELIALEKALDIFKFPFRFETVSPVVFTGNSTDDLFLISTGISEDSYLKKVFIYQDSTRKILVDSSLIINNFYKIETSLTNIHGEVLFQNEYLKFKAPFLFRR